jgi:general secretion pathway protein D
LIVKNTLQQLDYIEGIIEGLNKTVAKQVEITTKFVEISQRNGEELGFDTLIGAFNIGSRTFGAGGTSGNQGPVNSSDFAFIDPNAGGSASPIVTGQNPTTSGLRSGSRAIATNAIDGLLANGITSGGAKLAAPGILSLAGVFTDPQFNIVLRALSQKKGVDLMTAPSIVAKGGQRAKIEIIREFPYPTDFDPPQIPQTFGSSNATGGFFGGAGAGTSATSASSFPVTPTTPTSFTTRNTGVTMEVDPVIGEDNLTIDLTLAPEVVEFEGFINYGSPINSSAINALGIPTTLILTENRIEQPVFATRKLSTSVTIWDGQTVGIGGLMREDVQMVEDKVPLLGDIPFFGRLFKTKSEEHFKKNLMVYVSAKLIDPSGNRINDHRESSTETNNNGPESTLMPSGN